MRGQPLKLEEPTEKKVTIGQKEEEKKEEEDRKEVGDNSGTIEE